MAADAEASAAVDGQSNRVFGVIISRAVAVFTLD